MRFRRLLSEPTIHFFILAAAIVVGQRLIVGNPRTIVITQALRADLLRRYRDQLGRSPTSAEVATYLRDWKRDEALYREALREGIDRNDPTVRNVLIGRIRDRAMQQTPIPKPTEAQLQQYFEQHRDLFETPLTYEHEYVVFPKSEPDAEQKREKYERELKAGATPASLGLRSVAAIVNRERIEREFGSETADRICHLPAGQWQPLEAPGRLLLVKMIRIQGGLPESAALHERLALGWKAEMEQKAMERVTRTIADRYRFEEPSE